MRWACQAGSIQRGLINRALKESVQGRVMSPPENQVRIRSGCSSRALRRSRRDGGEALQWQRPLRLGRRFAAMECRRWDLGSRKCGEAFREWRVGGSDHRQRSCEALLERDPRPATPRRTSVFWSRTKPRGTRGMTRKLTTSASWTRAAASSISACWSRCPGRGPCDARGKVTHTISSMPR